MTTSYVPTPAITQTYEDVEKLIKYLCWKFQKQRGGDFDDLLSVANMGFMRAYNTYVPTRSKFTTWVWHCVWNILLDEMSKSHWRSQREKTSYDTELLEKVDPIDERFDLGETLKEYSKDSQVIMKLVLTSPEEILRLCHGEEKTFRSPVRAYLGKLGWTARRIAESFRDIKMGLT